MKKILVGFCVSILFVTIMGCGTMRKSLTDISKSDLKNAETTRIVAKNLLSTWHLNSGFIKGALGERIKELPYETLIAIAELDQIADRQNLSDQELGYSLGLRIRMLSEIVLKTIEQYAPDILKYLPAVFGL